METVRIISTMSTAAMRIQGLMILYLQKHIREKYTGDEKVLLFTEIGRASCRERV